MEVGSEKVLAPDTFALGQTDKSRGDVGVQIIIAILIASLIDFVSLFFIC